MLRAPINATAAGNNILVAPVANNRIRVCGYVLVGGGTVTAQFQSSGGTALTGAMALAAQTVVSVPQCPNEMTSRPGGWFESLPGEGLNLNLGGAVSVQGHFLYLLIPM